ncbi:MAG: hypothetical protein JXQ26_07830 [Tissierellales bacterium]|jgi:DNA-binding SARP family transcriptional activator|nr:hypothetical protein [Tissierellales bacterium]MBN2827883.1 hypothetical protein [Tissierellales bacterium]
MKELRIDLLGPIKIEYNNKSIYNKLSHKARCILCYLVTEKYVSKEKLACMFWEESSESASKYNLRYNIWSVNKLFKDLSGDEALLLEWDKDRLIISDHYTVKSDIEEFNELFINKSNEYESLSELKHKYRGSFLEGLHLKDSFEFNDWLFFLREAYQRKYLEILQKTFQHFKKMNLMEKSIEVMEEILLLNPLDEDIYVELIELHLLNGDRTCALKTYNRCVHVLREELNISPKETTVALLKKIKSQEQMPVKDLPRHHNISFYIISANQIESLISNSVDSTKKLFFVNAIPLKNLNYGLLASVIDLMINNYSVEHLSRIQPSIWSELYRINIRTRPYFKEFIHLNSPDTEKCRIFSALTELINQLIEKQPTYFLINNFAYIDNFSFEYIKYALYKNSGLNPKLILVSDEHNEKIQELKNFFTILKFDFHMIID